VVTESMKDVALPAEAVTFYARALADNRLDAVTRNNMAQALHNQTRKDPERWRGFLALLDDPKQDRGWRVFCLQHLTMSCAYTGEEGRRATKKRLLREARQGEPDFAARAVIMLDSFQRSSYGSVPELDDLIATNLENPKADDLMKISVLGVMGSRGDTRHLPTVRRLARTPGPAQRVAVATLGRIGDKSDIALLESLKPEPGSLLEAAIRGALKRLREKEAQTRQEARTRQHPRTHQETNTP